ncbi:hypothetical protein JCM24511_01012 [Saitozyma sp. JCM 24511]|nr:hypothetical protein JCM24511_01012 [Saitozyma sp. JCM 24511]
MRSALRPTLRAARAVARRNASSQSSSPLDNPNVQKAVEGAQKAYEQGAATVRRVAGPIGDRVGSALGSYREPIVYNAKVAASLARQVYQAERLAPPTKLHDWATAYAQIWSRASNINFWRDVLKTGAWAGLAVAGLEAYGIFKLGEIIGRRNLVGYKIRD